MSSVGFFDVTLRFITRLRTTLCKGPMAMSSGVSQVSHSHTATYIESHKKGGPCSHSLMHGCSLWGVFPRGSHVKGFVLESCNPRFTSRRKTNMPAFLPAFPSFYRNNS